jgi:hypothetical protein
MFKLEKGIPFVERQQYEGSKYPFSLMEVGDSFEFEASIIIRVQSAACNAGKRGNMKFKAHKVSKDKGRCWRVK